MKLLPETHGQAAQMTVCEGPDTNAEEVGHWYSPAHVARLIEAEREACTARIAALAEDLREYLYRVSSQVPFEHAQWAQDRGAALLAALRANNHVQRAARKPPAEPQQLSRRSAGMNVRRHGNRREYL